MVGALALVALTGAPNRAADHFDPPARTDPTVDQTPDLPADIADVYAWHANGMVNLSVTFAGPNVNTAPAFYDRNVLYKVLISTAPPDDTPEVAIRVRFGAGTRANEFGVRFEGLPGVNGTLEGPVETNLTKDGVTARAGLFDDPFTFDLVGFRQIRPTGQVRFNNTRDFFDNQNDTGFVISIPQSRIANGTGTVRIWSTTSRIGGQI
ncbi:DUF4331 domain-containing protein [Tsuneonella sp. YG55]|uniref:DUF4331 domain-containing protein n=1 Tax=Tsuneonella litorea TaxID=2976475 RepID=A0A9X2W068_9SPHN|nr:DUF4331 domain-containing protein [Tsuneonella litorea]MCT2557470.1 DUF4331 domain-containing protein [Tsuneonella litorea]